MTRLKTISRFVVGLAARRGGWVKKSGLTRMAVSIQRPIGVQLVMVMVLLALPFTPAHGDAITGAHLDPFFTPGPVAAGAVGPAAAGTPGEIVPAGMAGVPWSIAFTAPAADALFLLAAPWIWIEEFDFIGVTGLVPVFFPGFIPGAVLIPFGPGSDFIMYTVQLDDGGEFVVPFSSPLPTTTGTGLFEGCVPPALAGEIGSVCKQLVNFLTSPIAWGTAVDEAVALPGGLGPFGGIVPGGGGPPIPFPFNPTFPQNPQKIVRPVIMQNGQIAIIVGAPIPEPGTLFLLCAGLGTLIGFSKFRNKQSPANRT